MASKTVTIEGVKYDVDKMSTEARAQVASLNFVYSRIQQLNNEWEISDTARIGYSNALKRELEKK